MSPETPVPTPKTKPHSEKDKAFSLDNHQDRAYLLTRYEQAIRGLQSQKSDINSQKQENTGIVGGIGDFIGKATGAFQTGSEIYEKSLEQVQERAQGLQAEILQNFGDKKNLTPEEQNRILALLNEVQKVSGGKIENVSWSKAVFNSFNIQGTQGDGSLKDRAKIFTATILGVGESAYDLLESSGKIAGVLTAYVANMVQEGKINSSVGKMIVSDTQNILSQLTLENAKKLIKHLPQALENFSNLPPEKQGEGFGKFLGSFLLGAGIGIKIASKSGEIGNVGVNLAREGIRGLRNGEIMKGASQLAAGSTLTATAATGVVAGNTVRTFGELGGEKKGGVPRLRNRPQVDIKQDLPKAIELNQNIAQEALERGVADDVIRAERLTEKGFTPDQVEAILKAHKIKKEGESLGNYGSETLGDKIRIMEKSGISREQAIQLLKEGYAGELPKNTPDFLAILNKNQDAGDAWIEGKKFAEIPQDKLNALVIHFDWGNEKNPVAKIKSILETYDVTEINPDGIQKAIDFAKNYKKTKELGANPGKITPEDILTLGMKEGKITDSQFIQLFLKDGDPKNLSEVLKNENFLKGIIQDAPSSKVFLELLESSSTRISPEQKATLLRELVDGPHIGNFDTDSLNKIKNILENFEGYIPSVKERLLAKLGIAQNPNHPINKIHDALKNGFSDELISKIQKQGTVERITWHELFRSGDFQAQFAMISRGNPSLFSREELGNFFGIHFNSLLETSFITDHIVNPNGKYHSLIVDGHKDYLPRFTQELLEKGEIGSIPKGTKADLAESRSGIPRERVLRNSQLPPQERIEEAGRLLRITINEDQAKVILNLHETAERGLYNKKAKDFREIFTELKAVGIDQKQARILIENGILGKIDFKGLGVKDISSILKTDPRSITGNMPEFLEAIRSLGKNDLMIFLKDNMIHSEIRIEALLGSGKNLSREDFLSVGTGLLQSMSLENGLAVLSRQINGTIYKIIRATDGTLFSDMIRMGGAQPGPGIVEGRNVGIINEGPQRGYISVTRGDANGIYHPSGQRQR